MISRIWHGWTTPADADAYETVLREEIFPGIAARRISGYRGFQVLRRPTETEVEFISILRFDDLEAVRRFAGDDYEVAVMQPQDLALLSHFDAHSQHYEIRTEEVA